MSPFEFVLGLLGIIFVYKLITIYLEQRSSNESASAERKLNDDVAERLTDLENRVQVLERIVTDRRSKLRKEFEDLRD